MKKVSDWTKRDGIASFEGFAAFGDLIEIKRGFYEHWVVYIGTFEDMKKRLLYVYDFRDVEARSWLRQAGFSKFRESNDLLVLEFNAENSILGLSSSLHWEAGCVVNRLLNTVGEDKFRICNPDEPAMSTVEILNTMFSYVKGDHPPYNAITFNCEHMANAVRCGTKVSNQAITGIVHGLAVIPAVMYPPFAAATVVYAGFNILKKMLE